MPSLYWTSGFRADHWRFWTHWLNPLTHARRVKWLLQRAFRGYADCDLWSFDSYLAGMIPKALYDLRTVKHGIPVGLTESEWNGKLDLMISGFEAARDINNPPDRVVLNNTDKYVAWEKRKKKRFEQGMTEFTEHFFSLWD